MRDEPDTGASAAPTGLAGAKALEPHSRLHPSDGIPSAARAWLDVSSDFLRDALLLPSGCQIRDAICGGQGVVAVLVEHEAIHPDAMRVKAIYEKDFDGPRFKEWKATAKRDPSRGSDVGGAE